MRTLARMDADIKASYIDFVNRSFRDVADGDYLAARALYRLELGPQFLWSAQQAVEKYLKGILLYNYQETKSLGHDVDKAFQKLNEITDIPFDFPEDVVEFIAYLKRHGNNRYFEKHAAATGKELLMLDTTIWHIRRYCYYMRGQSTSGSDGRRVDLFPLQIDMLKSFPVEKANAYRISGGYIEKVLKQKAMLKPEATAATPPRIFRWRRGLMTISTSSPSHVNIRNSWSSERVASPP